MVREPTKDLFDPQAFLAKVGTGKTISVYQKDQIIFSQGEAADTIFYIQKGSVKIVVVSDQGKEAVVGILEAGQFFGEGCMNGHSLRIATSTATEESLITAITKPAMIAIMHDEPKFSELFVAYLLTRNSRIEDDLIDQLFNSSEKRLARVLLLLAKFGKEGNSPTPISPNISQETLAEMIGTTRSRVSFFLANWASLATTEKSRFIIRCWMQSCMTGLNYTGMGRQISLETRGHVSARSGVRVIKLSAPSLAATSDFASELKF